MKRVLLYILIFSAPIVTIAQGAIGILEPDPSAALHIEASNKGVLIPRINLSSRTDTTTITGPIANSLLIYNINATLGEGFYYWDNSASVWRKLTDDATKTVREVFSAEYAGATLYADGSDNTGMMTSDNTGASGNYMNYYEWSSGEAIAQDYDVIVRFTLPNDFTAWDAVNPIVIDYQAEGTSTFSATMFLEGGTSLGNISATSSATWTTANLNPGVMGAGQTAVIILKLTSAPNDDTKKVRIGDITLSYKK